MVPKVYYIVTKYITFKIIMKIKKQFKNENSMIIEMFCSSGEAFT